MYNMISYESKGVHAEKDIIDFPLVRPKINSYPRKWNNCGDAYIMVLLDDDHLGKTPSSMGI